MSLKIELTDEAEQPVLSVRTRTTAAGLQQEMGKAFGAVMGYLAEIMEQAAGVPFAVYYNLEMEDLDVEMGFPVAKPLAGKGNVKPSSIPAGKRASCVFKGPYTQMAPAYESLTKWVAENGHTPTGVCYEFYLNSPMEVPESELMTKIVFPLK